MSKNRQVFLVTGASSGVGRSIVEHFAGRKNNLVYAAARSTDALKELEEQFSGIRALPLDVSDSIAVKEAVTTVEQESGPIDVLVNNASLSITCELEEMDFSVIDKVIDVNLKGTLYCTYAVLPGMIRKGGGYVFNVSSIAGIQASRVSKPEKDIEIAPYGTSKFGVVGFGEQTGSFLQHGVLMTTLCPGSLNTPFWHKDGRNQCPGGEPEKLTDPEEIAELIDFILRQPKKTLFKQVVFFPTCEWH